MTLSEFKAWLDGFKAAIDNAPTEDQWELIQDKIGEITQASDTTYVPYYVEPRRSWPRWYETYYASGNTCATKLLST